MKYTTNDILKQLSNTDTRLFNSLDKMDLGSFPNYKAYKESDSLRFQTLHSRMKHHLMSGAVDLSSTDNLIEEAYQFFVERFDVITTTDLPKEQMDLVDGMKSVWILYALNYTMKNLSEIDETYFRESDEYIRYDSSPYVIDNNFFGRLTMVVIDKELETSAKRKQTIRYSYSNN